MLSHNCPICGKEVRRRPEATYCSEKCRKQKAKERYAAQNAHKSGLPTGTVGALHELRVCADLLAQGFHVFRSMSPSCPCDLAILRDTQLLRVEVRAGHKSVAGRVRCSWDRLEYADVLAVVLGSGKIIYQTRSSDDGKWVDSEFPASGWQSASRMSS